MMAISHQRYRISNHYEKIIDNVVRAIGSRDQHQLRMRHNKHDKHRIKIKVSHDIITGQILIRNTLARR